VIWTNQATSGLTKGAYVCCIGASRVWWKVGAKKDWTSGVRVIRSNGTSVYTSGIGAR